MPRYDFTCNNCKIIEKDIFISAEMVNSKNWKKRCDKCNHVMEVYFSPEDAKYIGFSWKGEAPAGQQVRNKKDAKRVEAIFNEGWQSKSEQQEAAEIAKEYEKEKGLVPGTIMGSRPAPITKADKEVVRKRDRAKRTQQQAMRRKLKLPSQG